MFNMMHELEFMWVGDELVFIGETIYDDPEYIFADADDQEEQLAA